MSGDEMDFLDLMGREGPCFHCGIDHTPLWRNGPPEKPVLCNACGSRWKTRGTLEDYMPKHAVKAAQRSQPNLFPKLNPTSFASQHASKLNPTSFAPQHAMKDAQSSLSKLLPKLIPTGSAPIHGIEKPKLFGSNVVEHDQPSFVFGSNVVGHVQPSFVFRSNVVVHNQSPFVFGAGTNYGSGSGRAVSENSSRTRNVEEAIQAPLWDPNNVSRKKRSTLEQRVLTATERLHQQLYIAMEEQSDDVEEEDPESVLIFERINKYIPENEIGLGCMLLKPPPSPTKDSKSQLKPESSIGVKAAAAVPPAKDSNYTSGLINVPIGESSEDDISAPKAEPLGVSTESTGELRNNNPQHHMITRSRAKNGEGHRLLGDIGSSGPSGEGEVQHLNRRSRVACPYI